MSHRYDPQCRCVTCGPLNEERAKERYVDWDKVYPEPEDVRNTGYINEPGDEYSKGRITQNLKPDGSMSYRFLRTR